MKQITMEVQSAKDIQLLLQLVERLHIKTKIEDKRTKVRVNWEEEFKSMASSKGDTLLDGYTATEFDKYEWKW
jgi:hypothetical protein